MDTFIRKTVLTLTAFMSVNSAFANSLTPTPENKAQNGVVTAQRVETKNKNKEIANSLPPTFEGKALADTLPPTPERAIANSLPPTFEGKAFANSLPPTYEGPVKVASKQNIGLKIRDTQHVRMA